MTEQEQLRDWQRPHYRPGGGDAFLFYAVFGKFTQPLTVSRSKYKMAGMPPELQVDSFQRGSGNEFMDSCVEGYLGELLREQGDDLYEEVMNAPECIRVAGQIEDPADLNYLRDTIGFLTALADQGGVAVYDPFRFAWWRPADWRKVVFEPDELVPTSHSLLMLSPEQADQKTWWIHSRGMRKFGRPDVSVRGISKEMIDSFGNLCGKLMELQILGQVLQNGYPIRTDGLPTVTCRHGGDLDDPDFNNVHVELKLP
jgi:hypothetical protein